MNDEALEAALYASRRSKRATGASLSRIGPAALTGLTPRSCCGPTATIAVPRFSIGVAPMG